MKIKNILLYGVTMLLLVSCANEDQQAASGYGAINVQISADYQVVPVTRSTPSPAETPENPDVNEFALKLVSTSGSFTRSWDSLADFDPAEKIPVGSYTMSAYHGDLEDEGFDKPYYLGEADVTVRDRENTPVEIHCTLANVKVTVEYSEAFKNYFADYATTVHATNGDYVKFVKDETRAAYVKPGKITIQTYLKKQNGIESTFEPAAIEDAKPRQHYRIKLDIADNAAGEAQLNISFDEIYDLLAVRIVFKPKDGIPEKQQCWNIYALITDLYSPKPERIRDWVSVPKANGYEALHLTVMGPEGQWFEVQIRSERMDEVAEKGLAAHWKYKGEGESSELDKWLANIKEVLDQPDATALEFLDEFKLNLFTKEIRVFTPKGYMRTLPKGATALDFAYDIHSEVGDTCIGAKVNHKLVPMSYKLSSGDQVEILTSDKQKPQREWLDFVVTAKARTHINAAFKKERKEMMRNGINTYEAVVKKLGMPPTSEPLNKALKHYGLINRDDLYVEIGKHNITPEDLEKALKKRSENKFIKYWNLQFLWNGKDSDEKKKGAASQVVDDSDFSIAPCCNPIPGDDVVGMKIAGTKVVVHKRSCPEAIRLMASFGDKIVPIKWVSHKLMSFLAIIKITGLDAPGMVCEITGLIAKEEKVTMRLIHFEARDGIFEGTIHLYVHNTSDLSRILSRISALKGVESVMRVESDEK